MKKIIDEVSKLLTERGIEVDKKELEYWYKKCNKPYANKSLLILEIVSKVIENS